MRTLISAATLALVLTACGGGDDGDSTQADPSPTGSPSTSVAASSSAIPTESSEAGGIPKCADVIVEGQTLPKDYDGCIDEDGSAVADGVYDDCEGGKELVKFAYNEEANLGAFLGEQIGKFNELFALCYP